MTVPDSNEFPAGNRHWPDGKWMRWSGPLAVAAVFVLMAALSWRKWADIVIDYGSQLYVPWRLASGAVLYHDLIYEPGGPFSQYFNALLFRIFGVSFTTLILANLTFTAGMLVLIYRRFQRVADSWTATTICLAIVLVFAFGRFDMGNYNYVAPYSHEALHGLILSILVLVFLTNWLETNRWRDTLGAGLCYGLVFLTKPDIFLAISSGLIAAIFLARRNAGSLWKFLGIFGAAALVGPLFFLIYFLRHENMAASVQSVAFAWAPLTKGVTSQYFYRRDLGLDTPFFHLRQMLVQFLVIAGVTVFYAAAFRAVARQKQDLEKIQRRAMLVLAPLVLTLIYAYAWLQSGETLSDLSSSFSVLLACFWILATAFMASLIVVATRLKLNFGGSPWIVGLILVLPLLSLVYWFKWLDCGASLPLMSLTACIFIFWNYKTLNEEPRLIFPMLWSVFALVLLSKMGLFCQIHNYGFVLAMPAFVGAIYLLHWLLPLWLEKRGIDRRAFRWLVWVVLMCGCVQLARQAAGNYKNINYAVGSGGDEIKTADSPSDHRGPDIEMAILWMKTNMPPDATLAVLPEGTMINYLCRRVNSTGCLAWSPAELGTFGQTNLIARFEEHSPDYVMLLHRPSREFGLDYFGQQPEFGRELVQWVRKNYDLVFQVGDPPLQGSPLNQPPGYFGLQILKRHSAAQAKSNAN